MTDILTTLWGNPILHGAVLGGLVAARVDYMAFIAMKTPGDALAYDWKVAAWRWFQGAVMGAVAAHEVS